MFFKPLEKLQEFELHGVRVPGPGHERVRRLKMQAPPPIFGSRIWSSTWVLIDFLKRNGLAERSRILEIGCGWGLAGIYCAKNHRGRVTCLDNDAGVFPYLKLLSELNRVQLNDRQMKIEDVNKSFLKDFDLVIGADICFSQKLIEPLRNLIQNAGPAGTQAIVLADPGRTSFHALARYYHSKKGGCYRTWKITSPNQFTGYVLKIAFPG